MKYAICVLLVLCAASARAQNTLGIVGLEGGTASQVDFWLETSQQTSDNSWVGGFVWGLSQSDWAEIYVGPVVYPSSSRWLEIAAGIGVETNKHPVRVGISVLAVGRGNTAFLVWEKGGSGQWYQANYSHRITKHLNLGFFSRRFSSTGPMVEIPLTNQYKIWATAGPDLETADHRIKVIIGLNFRLS